MSVVAEPHIIRPAQAGDIPDVYDIYSYYVLHTITDLYHETPSLGSFTAEYESLTSNGLPYLVAVSSSGLANPQTTAQARENSVVEHTQPPEVLGFIHAFPFRGYKVGYAITAELAIMCHPDAIKKGVGSALMKAFLDAIAKNDKIEQILAFMTVLENEVEDRRVKGFYEKWGFREAGMLTGVGQKFGKR